MSSRDDARANAEHRRPTLFFDGTRAAASHPAVESAARSPRPSIVADAVVFEIERAAN